MADDVFNTGAELLLEEMNRFMRALPAPILSELADLVRKRARLYDADRKA